MTEELLGAEREIAGSVKWFDPVKGFGFIVSDEGGPDILLHANVLRSFGQGSVADGSRINAKIQSTDRGVQATEVLAIVPPATDSERPLEDLAHVSAEELEQIKVEPARVKWFDKAKGFGFANLFASSEDIFIHIEVLRRSGLSDLQTGEAVGLRVVDGQRGRMAMQVCPWEAGVTS